jgi:hypothetical protein
MSFDIINAKGTLAERLVEARTRLVEGCSSNDIRNPESQRFRVGCREAVRQLGRMLKAKKDSPEFIAPEEVSLSEWLWAMCPNIDSHSDITDVSEAITQSSFPTLTQYVLNPTVIEPYQSELAGADELVSDFGDAQARDERIGGFKDGQGLATVYPGELFPDDTIGEKFVQVKTAEFGKVLKLDWSAIRFDRTGELMGRARDIGTDMGIHRHTFIMQKLQDVAVTATGEATTTAWRYKGTADAVFETSGTRDDGQTNYNGTTGAFSYANFNAVVNLLLKMVDDAGKKIVIRPTHLIVPVGLEQVALQLIMSSGQYDVANNATNVAAQRFRAGAAPRVFTSPVLDDTSGVQYYVGAPARSLVWIWTQKPQVLATATHPSEAAESNVLQKIRVWYGGGCGYRTYHYMARSTGA